MTTLSHLVSVEDLNPDLLHHLMNRAAYMRASVRRGSNTIMAGRIMAAMFYEPSLRTRFSHEAAMLHMGGRVIGTENGMDFTSWVKGESLEDTIRVVAGYADVIVLRHSHRGSAARAAAVSPIPVINAGDGDGEHPTQALLDLFTIQDERKRPLGDEHVVFVGDLMYGRTVHSLARLLKLFGTKMSFISPPELSLPEHLVDELGDLILHQGTDLSEVITAATVLYMTRTQKERLQDEDVASDGSSYTLTHELAGRLSSSAAVLHPLPRNSEIPTWFDADPRAAYFRQSHNGLHVRMALLEALLAPLDLDT